MSESRYRLLVEQIPAVVYEMDRDDERRTLYVSPHVEEILGYSRQEWLDQPDIWTELLHEDDREIELAAHDQHTETGEPWSPRVPPHRQRRPGGVGSRPGPPHPRPGPRLAPAGRG